MFQSTYNPMKEFLDWAERTGNLASWGAGATGLDRSSVSPVGLSGLGAPRFMVDMAQQQSSATPNMRASEFLMKLQSLLGEGLRAQIPGIERVNMHQPRGGMVVGSQAMPRVEPLADPRGFQSGGGYNPAIEELMTKLGLGNDPMGHMQLLALLGGGQSPGGTDRSNIIF